ncbi:MAG: cytochrome b N-terminal domain-containing protein [Acidobacteria bacterium]|nr:cytochrome b N-terminal domain-containing protein [Acidobacteriota bacterium]
MNRIRHFFKTRLGNQPFRFLRDPVPGNVGWVHSLGSALLFLLMFQLATGIFLMLFYSPGPESAWESIRFLMDQNRYAALLRSLHSWTTSLLVVLFTLHLLRVLTHGAYKPPRELTWISGILLLSLIFAFAFSGYLLRWDNPAYWATQVGTEMMEEIPLVGRFIMRFSRGGDELGAYTLTRFYAVHVAFLPALLLSIVAVHLWQLRKHQIAPHPLPEKNHRAPFPFFPSQAVRDSVVSLVLFLLLLLLAVLYPQGLGNKANPADAGFDPRPEWYFLAHYELLRLFQGWETVSVFLIPFGLFLLLLLLPFLDRSTSRYWKNRKRIVVSTFVFFGVLYGAALYSKLAHPPQGPGSAIENQLPLPPSGNRKLILDGRRAFQQLKCANCHSIAKTGGRFGPELDGIGAKYSPEEIRARVLTPRRFDPESKMPSYEGEISPKELEALMEYIRHFPKNVSSDVSR